MCRWVWRSGDSEGRNTMRTFAGELGMTQFGEFHEKGPVGAEQLFQILESLVLVNMPLKNKGGHI